MEVNKSVVNIYYTAINHRKIVCTTPIEFCELRLTLYDYQARSKYEIWLGPCVGVMCVANMALYLCKHLNLQLRWCLFLSSYSYLMLDDSDHQHCSLFFRLVGLEQWRFKHPTQTFSNVKQRKNWSNSFLLLFILSNKLKSPQTIYNISIYYIYFILLKDLR